MLHTTRRSPVEAPTLIDAGVITFQLPPLELTVQAAPGTAWPRLTVSIVMLPPLDPVVAHAASRTDTDRIRRRMTDSLEVERALVHRQRRFLGSFGKRRVSVADAGDIFGGGAELHRHHGFGDQLG